MSWKTKRRILVVVLVYLICAVGFIQLVMNVYGSKVYMKLWVETMRYNDNNSTKLGLYQGDLILGFPGLDKVLTKRKTSQHIPSTHSLAARRISKPKIQFEDVIFNKCKGNNVCKNHTYVDFKNLPAEILLWKNSENNQCNNQFTGYDNEFAYLQNALFDLKKCQGKKGGEAIEDVFRQSEKSEYFTFRHGCLLLQCEKEIEYNFNNKNHLNELMSSLHIFQRGQDLGTSNGRFPVIKELTILITRYEYANLYHTMSDWYNAFVVMSFFNQTQQDTHILFVDGHPQGALDPVWPILFGSVKRLGEFTKNVRYEKLVFNILSYNSFFVHLERPFVPMLEPFRHFFLQSYGIDPDAKKLDCQKLSILFIWRRNYIAHPRNPSGTIQRKIANEGELIRDLRSRYPKFLIEGVQIETLDFSLQLITIANTDVLIGMHGAGMTHAVFLPKHAGVIELTPSYINHRSHFMMISEWRKLQYLSWKNDDKSRELPDYRTIVPSNEVIRLVDRMYRNIGC